MFLLFSLLQEIYVQGRWPCHLNCCRALVVGTLIYFCIMHTTHHSHFCSHIRVFASWILPEGLKRTLDLNRIQPTLYPGNSDVKDSMQLSCFILNIYCTCICRSFVAVNIFIYFHIEANKYPELDAKIRSCFSRWLFNDTWNLCYPESEAAVQPVRTRLLKKQSDVNQMLKSSAITKPSI